MLELPLVEPGVHFGSVATTTSCRRRGNAPAATRRSSRSQAFDFYFLRNRISCGVWLPGDEEELERPRIRFVTFHEGVYAQAEVPGAWFGWRELVARGYTPLRGRRRHHPARPRDQARRAARARPPGAALLRGLEGVGR